MLIRNPSHRKVGGFGSADFAIRHAYGQDGSRNHPGPARRSDSPYPIFTADELHAILRNDPEKTKSLLGRNIEVIGKVDHVYDNHARIWVQLWLFTENPPPKGTSENVLAILRGPPGGHSPTFLKKINDIKWGKQTSWITIVGTFKTNDNLAIIDPAIFVGDLPKD